MRQRRRSNVCIEMKCEYVLVGWWFPLLKAFLLVYYDYLWVYVWICHCQWVLTHIIYNHFDVCLDELLQLSFWWFIDKNLRFLTLHELNGLIKKYRKSSIGVGEKHKKHFSKCKFFINFLVILFIFNVQIGYHFTKKKNDESVIFIFEQQTVLHIYAISLF